MEPGIFPEFYELKISTRAVQRDTEIHVDGVRTYANSVHVARWAIQDKDAMQIRKNVLAQCAHDLLDAIWDQGYWPYGQPTVQWFYYDKYDGCHPWSWDEPTTEPEDTP